LLTSLDNLTSIIITINKNKIAIAPKYTAKKIRPIYNSFNTIIKIVEEKNNPIRFNIQCIGFMEKILKNPKVNNKE
jgi:hypothetical protein